MLGLRRHHVRLASSDPTWGPQFREWQGRISAATGVPVDRIQHIGSTSVPELPAKPILDIDLGLVELDDLEAVVSCLVEAGFMDRGLAGGPGRLLVWESAPDIRTIHVHIVTLGSQSWHQDLAFRDALRADPELRDRYAEIKKELAERLPTDRRSYREAKNHFIAKALDQLAAHRNTDSLQPRKM